MIQVQPILPIFNGENKKYKKSLDKQHKKKYNANCQKQFEDYLKECLNNERQNIL